MNFLSESLRTPPNHVARQARLVASLQEPKNLLEQRRHSLTLPKPRGWTGWASYNVAGQVGRVPSSKLRVTRSLRLGASYLRLAREVPSLEL